MTPSTRPSARARPAASAAAPPRRRPGVAPSAASAASRGRAALAVPGPEADQRQQQRDLDQDRAAEGGVHQVGERVELDDRLDRAARDQGGHRERARRWRSGRPRRPAGAVRSAGSSRRVAAGSASSSMRDAADPDRHAQPRARSSPARAASAGRVGGRVPGQRRREAEEAEQRRPGRRRRRRGGARGASPVAPSARRAKHGRGSRAAGSSSSPPTASQASNSAPRPCRSGCSSTSPITVGSSACQNDVPRRHRALEHDPQRRRGGAQRRPRQPGRAARRANGLARGQPVVVRRRPRARSAGRQTAATNATPPTASASARYESPRTIPKPDLGDRPGAAAVDQLVERLRRACRPAPTVNTKPPDTGCESAEMTR